MKRFLSLSLLITALVFSACIQRGEASHGAEKPALVFTDTDRQLSAAEQTLAAQTGIRLNLRKTANSFSSTAEYELGFDEAAERTYLAHTPYLTRAQVIDALEAYDSELREYLERTPQKPGDFLQRPAEVKRAFVEARLARERWAQANARAHASALKSASFATETFKKDCARLEEMESRLKALGMLFQPSEEEAFVLSYPEAISSRTRLESLREYAKALEVYLGKYSFELSSDVLSKKLEAVLERLEKQKT